MSEDPFKPTYIQTLKAVRQAVRKGHLLSSLWRQPGKWPIGGKRMIFCAEAVDRVGRTKFGSDWNGREVWAHREVDAFPDFADTLAEFQRALADYKNRESKPTGASRSLTNARNSAAEDLVQDAEIIDRPQQTRAELRDQITASSRLHLEQLLQWGAKHRGAYDAASAKWDRFTRENANALDRLSWACDWLTEKARDGDVLTYLRLVDSGERGAKYEPAPDGFWNVEDIISWRLRDAAVGEIDANEAAYIFFEMASFESSLRDICIFDSPETLNHLHLSTFMQLLLRAIEVHEITPQNQPKAAFLAKWFEDEWVERKFDRVLDKRLFKAMATFVRDLEGMDGRGRK